MERLLQDVRFGVRLLWRDRVFALTSLLTLAVCIGVNTAIFAVVNSVLLRPLQLPDPSKLVLIYNAYPRAGVERSANGVPDYYDRLREVEVLEEQALYNTRGVTVAAKGEPERITAMLARPSLLRMLKAEPLRGRIFTEEEGDPGYEQKVILTYGTWQEVFGGREDAVGSDLRINGVPHTVVGVLPRTFTFLNPDVRLWLPLAFSVEERSDDRRHSNNWSMLGRLRPGASIAQVQQQLDALNARNMERFPHFKEILTNAGFHTVAASLEEDVVRGVRGTLYLLWGAVLFVLLIGVVNITNLVLVRSSGRTKELATRHALGAALSRLTRQLITEIVLLTLAGAAGGLLVGYLGLTLLTNVGLERLPRADEIRMDTVVVLFTIGLAFVVGILIAVVPAFNLRHTNLSQAFREESRSGTAGRGARFVRRTLVASQVAFAFMLLAGAGLLLASFQRVIAISPGFDPENVVTARISLPALRYTDDSARSSFSTRLLERVRSLPGVQRAGLTSSLPFGGDYSDSVILAEGYKMSPGESLISPFQTTVTPGYFESMGIAVRSGRTFTDGDTATSPRVVIVDERLARRFWPGIDPIGRRMFSPDNPNDLLNPGPNARYYTVVGVVSEIRMSGLIETEDRVGAYYFPFAQDPYSNITLTVRTAANPIAMTSSIRRELSAIDPELPLFSVRTMSERVDASLVDRRTPMVLTIVFAAVALFLAAVGLYGVLAYQVSQRRREIGIRMALGSNAGGIFRLVLGEGLQLLAIGFVIGIAGAFALRRALQTQLYEIGPMDPLVLSTVAGVLALVSLLASTIPARRAAKTDPLIALSEN
jgi:predicted permease